MKSWYIFCGGFCLGAISIMTIVEIAKPIPRKTVMLEKTFDIEGKEFQCGYTPRQVEINLLEDKIAKLKQ